MKTRRGMALLSVLPIIIGVSLPCLFYFHFLHEQDSKANLANAIKISNQPLPFSRLLQINDNADLSEKVHEGKILLIFLSTTCVACKKDVQLITKHYASLRSKIQVYGLNIENKEIMRSFVQENRIEFPILNDENLELFRKLKISHFPTKYLVNDGIIVKTFIGNFPNDEKLFEDLEIEGEK